jgi:hypothetical protein
MPMLQAEKTAAAIAAHDAKQEQQQTQQSQAREAQLQSAREMEALKEQSISQALADATQFEGLLEGFCARLKALTGASSVYVAQRTTPSLLQYVAATEDNKFMLEQSLDKVQLCLCACLAQALQRSDGVCVVLVLALCVM